MSVLQVLLLHCTTSKIASDQLVADQDLHLFYFICLHYLRQ